MCAPDTVWGEGLRGVKTFRRAWDCAPYLTRAEQKFHFNRVTAAQKSLKRRWIIVDLI
jgi:hypothetical protein